MHSKWLTRGIFAFLLVVSAASLGASFVSAGGNPDDWQQQVSQRERPTVITTQPYAKYPNNGAIIAFGENGTSIYHNNTYDVYFDVDPVEDERRTVLYVGADRFRCPDVICWQNTVARVNISTGEQEILYAQVTSGRHGSRWHDVDQINETHLLIGDIEKNRVFVLDLESGMNERGWDVQTSYPLSSGGSFPSDWSHLNDVEMLSNGRIMTSLRNQDQVVFLSREKGLVSSWTLGKEDEYETLREQHNPDYIPSTQGGPAIVVADSGNNRILEYQRRNGSWENTWRWGEGRLSWPRDADRLPNGHTLIVDSNGGRVIEINRDGEIVWSVDVVTPYDAERLGTGDESGGGQSAQSLGLPSSGDGSTGSVNRDGGALSLKSLLRNIIPSWIWNGVLFILPRWVDSSDIIALATILITPPIWVAAELYWAPITLRIPIVWK